MNTASFDSADVDTRSALVFCYVCAAPTIHTYLDTRPGKTAIGTERNPSCFHHWFQCRCGTERIWGWGDTHTSRRPPIGGRAGEA